MVRTAILCLVMGLVVSAQAKLPNSWQEIWQDSKYKKSPTKELVQKPNVVKPTGALQLFKISDRYGFLFGPNGEPIIVFDYTMDPLTQKDLILGAIGIGRWSLRDLWSKYKKVKENPSDIIDSDEEVTPSNLQSTPDDAEFEQFYSEFAQTEDQFLGPASESDIKRGYREFSKLPFKESWINRNSAYRINKGDDKNTGFLPASFALSDLALHSKDQDKVYEVMRQFSLVVFRRDLPRDQLDQFLNQFKMDWKEETKEFDISWKPNEANMRAEPRPLIPGFVLYYEDPFAILSNRYALRNLERNVGYLDLFLGKFGRILGIFVSRISNGLISQMDYHENGLLALFEAYQRGEYVIDIPWEDGHAFVDNAITMLYLNKMIETEDVTDGVAKRQMAEAEEAKAKESVIKWLEKKKYTYQIWPNGRMATVFKGNKRKGVISLSVNKTWLFKRPSFLYYDNATWFKGAKRVAMEIFVDAVRFTLPSRLIFEKWISSWFAISIPLDIPSWVWDRLFRARSYREISYEGMAFMEATEGSRGIMNVPGYSSEELTKLRGTLANQRQNTFEVPLKYEELAIETNYKRVIDIIGKGTKEFTHIVP